MDKSSEVTDARGRTTVFEGAIPVARVSPLGIVKIVNRPPVWSRIRAVHYIIGGSLTRVSVVTGNNTNQMQVIVKKASDGQIENNCDTCPKHHRITNPTCSQNLGLSTFASDPHHLYDITSRKDKGEWSINSIFLGASKCGTGIFTKQS